MIMVVRPVPPSHAAAATTLKGRLSPRISAANGARHADASRSGAKKCKHLFTCAITLQEPHQCLVHAQASFAQLQALSHSTRLDLQRHRALQKH